MDELRNSPFFDTRTIIFIRDILNGHEPHPITADEQKVFMEANLLKDANRALNNTLIRKLESYMSHIPVVAASRFIAGAQKRDKLDAAIKVLEVMVKEERGADLRDLVKILKESETMLTEFAVYTNATQVEDRHKRPDQTNRSKLNLNAMRDFK